MSSFQKNIISKKGRGSLRNTGSENPSRCKLSVLGELSLEKRGMEEGCHVGITYW